MPKPINEDNLMTKRLNICENCEWCVLENDLPNCLITKTQIGLFHYCKLFEKRKSMEIS